MEQPPGGFGLGACRPVSMYSKGEKLGEGTYGSVYRAKDKVMGTVVALKRVKEQSFEREGMPQTSLREVALLRRLSHPYIVRLVEVVVGTRADSVFLVFEYCSHDLARLVDTLPPFPLAEVKCIVAQLLSAVAYLHANAILHRDIKMSNLLLSSEGELRLCDFGLAREHSAAAATPEEEGGAGAKESRAYTPRVVTLWYRAPELLLGATRYGPPVDMWSIGCVLGELILHRPLMPASTEIKQLELICELLGAPSVRIWPELAVLPLWPKVCDSLPDNEYNDLPSRFARVRPSQATLDLINALLTYDPAQRLAAPDALTHRWLRADHPPPAKRVVSATLLSREPPPRAGLPSSRKRSAVAAPARAPEERGEGGTKQSRSREFEPAPVSARARIPSPNEVSAPTARQC